MKYILSVLACLPLALAGLGDRFSIRDLKQTKIRQLAMRDTDPALLYPAHTLSIPIDHFHNESQYAPHSNGYFKNRYWFDASHYKPGGPVIVLLGGETDGAGRLPFLQKGILAQLAQATHGVGVVLEHRYYGDSIPTASFSTEDLRFLTTQQALADTAYFAQNIVFPGLEKYNLTSYETPYITYGGSYAGAFSAFLRTLYPGVFWGSISSSGVPVAIWDYWQYFSVIAEAGPADCINAQQTIVQIVDAILLEKNDPALTKELKTVFGVANLTHDDDLGSLISTGMYFWQSLNWDPAVSSNSFYKYCNVLTNTSLLYPGTHGLIDRVESVIEASGVRQSKYTLTSMLNFIGYINETEISTCGGETDDECLSARQPSFYAQDDTSQAWRLWPYQYCTQWGYLTTGSGVPLNQRPLVSRLMTLPYLSIICQEAFNITSPPDTDIINSYGGYDIAYDRLALIDGEVDPWRPAGPHAYDQGAPKRNNTIQQPFWLVEGGVHHWDENGLFANQTTSAFPPSQINDVQAWEATFVKAWVAEWHAARGMRVQQK